MSQSALLFYGAIVVLAFLILKDHMPAVGSFLSNLWSSMPFGGGNKSDNVSDNNNVKSGPPEIHEIVDEWEILRGMCKEAGLNPAVGKLDELFVLLNRKG